MERAFSVSAGELFEKTSKAADAVLQARIKEFGGKLGEVSYFPDIGVIGIRAPELDFSMRVAEAMWDTASEITSNVGELARAGNPVMLITRYGGTMGFFPAADVITAQGLK